MDTTAQTDHDPALTGEGADQAQALVYPRINCQDVNVFYSGKQAVFDVSLPVFDRSVTALIGPSGCGKSTFLRCLNRMNDTIDGAKVTGDIFMDGENINSPDVDPVLLRSRVGMVFQKPNPFPKSIYDNIAYGPRIHGLVDDRQELDAIVEKSLRRAGLWQEVKDRLTQPGRWAAAALVHCPRNRRAT